MWPELTVDLLRVFPEGLRVLQRQQSCCFNREGMVHYSSLGRGWASQPGGLNSDQANAEPGWEPHRATRGWRQG